MVSCCYTIGMTHSKKNHITGPINNKRSSVVPQTAVATGGAGRLEGPAGSGLEPIFLRTIFFLDLENLLRGRQLDLSQLAAVALEIEGVVGKRLDDQFIVGYSHVMAERAVHLANEQWPGCRHVVGSGAGGGKSELISALLDQPIRSKTTKIVVGSGDGIFAAPCRELQERGANVTVVAASAASLSARLKASTQDSRILSDAVRYGGGFIPSYPGQEAW